MTKKDIDAMERKLRRWLSEEGLYEDKIRDDEAYFNLVIEVPPGSGRKAHVVQPKPRDDLVVVASRTLFPEKVLESLKSLPKKKHEAFFWDVKFGLLFQKTNFRLLPNSEKPNGIEFTTNIHYDGMTKNALREAIDWDYRCTLWAIWKLQEKFGAELFGAPPQPPGYL